MALPLSDSIPDKSLAAFEGMLCHLQECLTIEAFSSEVAPILDPELVLDQWHYVVAESNPAPLE